MANPVKIETESNVTLTYVIEQLLEDNILSSQQIAPLKTTALIETNKTIHPIIIISELSLQSDTKPSYSLTIDQLTRWLAKKTSQEYFRIDPLKIDISKVTSVVSQAYANKLKILPVHVTNSILTIATCEPFNTSWVHELERITRRQIKRVIINPIDLERYLAEFYGVSRSLIGAVSESSNKEVGLLQNFEQLIEVGKSGEPDANDRHIVSLVDWVLQFAFEQRASDIHLEPRRDKGRVRFRIDGILHMVHDFPIALMGAITSRLKSLGRMDVTDKRRPQDGRIKTKTPSGNEVEMRLSTMPTAFGEKLVLRIFNPDMLMKDYPELGFSSYNMKCWEKIIDSPHGIILVTGPTGSGKTTTLYSTLKQIARPELNICTIEDPIELVDPLFNQMQVQPVIDVTFANGVRTLLRQDPDIIMVGEIRDKQTVEVTIQAALTGHLVLSSLHTNDAPSTITRLLDLGAQPYLIGATLLGILAQRLVRTLCPHCKKPGKLDKTAWEKLVFPTKLKLPDTAYSPVGCDECRHTGYMGRTGIYESLVIDKNIRNLINTTNDLQLYIEAAEKQGMEALKISGAQKIAEGLTTLEEIYATVPPNKDD
ncbi:MAG: general secretion pathway protein E [Gammaproteobacteria bacterium]|jgi:general secretion pathway protein E